MDFLDTFLPTFLANLLALVPFGLFLAWLNRETRMRLAKFGRSFSNAGRIWTFKVRFAWLVLTGRKQKSEYFSWLITEQGRWWTARLLIEAPAARRYMRKEIFDSLQKAIPSLIYHVNSESPFEALLATGKFLSMDEDVATRRSFESNTPAERARLLMSKTRGELALWAISLAEEDRAFWLQWLSSPESLDELEKALAEDST